MFQGSFLMLGALSMSSFILTGNPYIFYLELESSHPDHQGVSCYAKNNSQREEDDGHIVHDGIDVHICLVILGVVQRQRSVGRHHVAGNIREIQKNGNVIQHITLVYCKKI